MSIVTDALNRLQSARARVVRPTSSHDHDPPKSKGPEPQEDQKEQTYDTRFLTVSIGGFLVVLVMALGAYWWGESLVSEVPMLATSASSRTVVPPDPIVDENMDLLASAQNTSLTAEANIELPSGEQSTVSQAVEPQEGIISSQASEEKKEELIVSMSLQANAEPLLEKDAHVQEKASMTLEQEPVPDAINVGQELLELPLAILRQDRTLAKSEPVSSTSSGSADKEVPKQSLTSNPVKSEEQSRSDSSTPIATVAKSEKGISESDSSISHSKSTPSLPSVVATKFHPSSRDGQSQVQAPSHNVKASVSTVQSRLSPEQRLVKARLLIEQGSHAEAIDVLNPLFVTPPTKWEPWFWMGTAQFGIGDLDKAEDAFMEGLVRDDTVPYLWVQRSVIEQQRGHYGKAMDALRQAELLEPDLPEVRLNLAYNLEHQGNLKLARQHYQKYLSLTEGKSTYHAVRRKVLERVLRMGSS